MLGVYSETKTDSFRSQLQAVPTTFYEKIKGVHGASGFTKPKTVKRRFQDANEAGHPRTTPPSTPSPRQPQPRPRILPHGGILQLRLRLRLRPPAQPERRRPEGAGRLLKAAGRGQNFPRSLNKADAD